MKRIWFSLALAALGAGCDSRPAPPDRDAPPPRPPVLASSAAPQASAPAPTGIEVPAPPPTAAVAAAGAWEGTFTAAKGTVHLPEALKDTARDHDDGKSGVGAGKVSLAVAPDGEVTGSWTGALGKDVLRGRVETEGATTMLRATAMPEDPSARDAMSGILVGELKGDAFHAEIHVSAGDALTVREATFDLHKK